MPIEAAIEMLQGMYGTVLRADKLAKQLPVQWIEEALNQSGSATVRRRRLPMEQVVWVVIGMALVRNRPITEVVSKLDLSLPSDKEVAPSSITAARQRLGADALQWLCEKSASTWDKRAEHQDFHGLDVYAMDGVLFHCFDSATNEKEFGKASGAGYGPGGYPLCRMVTLSSVKTHLVTASALGGYRDSEHALLGQVLDKVPEKSVVVLDKNFHAMPVLWAFEQLGSERHFLVPAKKNTVTEKLAELGKGDYLVEIKASAGARKTHPELPASMQVRACWLRHPKTNKRMWFLTSLRDPKRYPRSHIGKLYRQRWEIEISYHEMKTHMLEAKPTLRSKKPDGVKQELWGMLLAYNLIRYWILSVAQKRRCSPLRISFVMVMRMIVDEWMFCAIGTPGSIPKKLQELEKQTALFILPKRKKKRSYPRAIKFKSSKYPKKIPTSRQLEP